MSSTTREEVRQLADTLRGALADGRIGDAESTWNLLQDAGDLAPESQSVPALILLAQGDTLAALQRLNELPGDLCPQLRVLCLRMLGDPSWHGEALALEDHPNPEIQSAVRRLLDDPRDMTVRR